MTAAMIASNSFWKPRRASVEPASSTVRTATSAAAQAVSMKRLVLTRSTGTPELRAALASPPDGEDPVADARAQEDPGARAPAKAMNQMIETGTPVTVGSAVRETWR